MTHDLVTVTVTIPREQLDRLEAELADLGGKVELDRWRARWGVYQDRVRAREQEER